jgi:hypothetical protein
VNDTLEKLLAQARELQRSTQEAVGKAADQAQPLLKESLEKAHDLQATLSKHTQESAADASAHTHKAIEHLGEFVKISLEATRHSAELAQTNAAKLAEHSREIAESLQAAINKKKG